MEATSTTGHVARERPGLREGQLTRRGLSIGLGAGLAGGASLVSACRQGGTAGGSAGTPAPAATASREVTISFAPGSWGTRAGRKEVTEAMLGAFTTAFPHLKVEVQQEAPDPTPNQTWITRVVAGDVPDVVISSGALFEWMAKRNVWADARPALQRLGWQLGEVYHNSATITYQGRQHAVPFVAHQGGALVYNKTLFGEAGVPAPGPEWTWDDVLEAARRLTRPEKQQWGINGELGHGVFFCGVWANQGEVLSQDTRQTRYAGPEGVEVLELLSAFTTRHRVSPTPEQRAAERLAFNAGNFAMEITTPGRQSAQGIGDRFEWDVTYFPRWPKTKRRVAIVDYSEWAVTSAAQQRGVVEEATHLALFYASDFTQGLIADISPAGTTPANKRVARSSRYLAPPPQGMHVIVDMLDGKDGTDSRGWPYFEYFQQWQLPIRTMLPRIYGGEIGVKDGLEQAAEAADREVAALRGS
jgi:ABC-type glycerol-3-phosphate transport system substrate-binding protein